MYFINRKRFILNNIEVLLKADLHPANIEASIQQQTFASIVRQLDSSGEAAIAALQDFRYEIPPADFRQLCQQNFSDLFRLKDSIEVLQKQQQVLQLNVEARELYALLCGMLCSVQSYLESTGIHGMAAGELLPPDFLSLRKTLLHGQVLLFRAKCISRNLEPRLCELLNKHFQQFLTLQCVTQGELDYTEALLPFLMELLVNASDEESERQVFYGLVSMNFNCSEGYAYCLSYIRKRSEGDIGDKLRLLRLRWMHKELTQQLASTEMACKPGYPSLRELLLSYLAAECQYTESLIEEEEPSAETSLPATAQRKDMNVGEKLVFDVSMRELTLFFHLLVKGNVVLPGAGGLMALAHFLALNVSTSAVESLSATSLRRRFYEAQPYSCGTMLSILENMIVILKRDFMGKPL